MHIIIKQLIIIWALAFIINEPSYAAFYCNSFDREMGGNEILVIEDSSTLETILSLSTVLKQLESDYSDIEFHLQASAISVGSALPEICAKSDNAIEVITEYKNWILYSDNAVRGEDGNPVFLVSGFAVKKDGVEVRKWNVW